MNGKRQPTYAAEFRQQIVELYASGRGPGELAKEFGCSEASVHAWAKKAGTLRSLPDAGSEERDELLRLRKENRRLQTERDILAKATAWFAGASVHTSTPSSRS